MTPYVHIEPSQCWLVIGEIMFNSPEGNLIGNINVIYPSYEFENTYYRYNYNP